jgi:hypothetical protein
MHLYHYRRMLIHPDRLALGRWYWPAIVLISACVPLFAGMILHLIPQLRQAATVTHAE